MGLKFALLLFTLFSLQSYAEETCRRPELPMQCYYYCYNGYAYDRTEWELECFDGKGYHNRQKTGIDCSTLNDAPRDYCNPPKHEG